MPAKVTYWTGIWRPELEATSGQVAALRRSLSPHSVVVSFSRGQSSALLWRDRVIRLSSSRWISLRAAASAIERLGRITHVWSTLGDWHFLQALGRRPVLFTVVLPGEVGPLARYAKVALFAVESEPLAAQLEQAGVSLDRIRLVYPGIDLAAYSPSPSPSGRFRLLFASSPADASEFDDRGIPVLVEVARACQDIDVILLWRNWGSASDASKALRALSPPPNLILEQRGDRTMPMVYRSAHAVACLYRKGFGKSCPNSIVEGLGCGRPALLSPHCGIAGLVTDAGAGVSSEGSVAHTVRAVRELQAGWPGFARSARVLAERTFDCRRFVAEYRAAYFSLAHDWS